MLEMEEMVLVWDPRRDLLQGRKRGREGCDGVVEGSGGGVADGFAEGITEGIVVIRALSARFESSLASESNRVLLPNRIESCFRILLSLASESYFRIDLSLGSTVYKAKYSIQSECMQQLNHSSKYIEHHLIL